MHASAVPAEEAAHPRRGAGAAKSRRPRARAFVFVAVLLMVVGACATLSRQAFAPPVVTVTDVRLAGVGLQGGRLDVVMSLYNPNGYRLDATGLRYRLMVDSLSLGEGTIERRISVKARDSITVRAPVSFSMQEVMTAGTRLLQRGAVPYTLVGEMTVATPFGGVRRAFEQRGTFDALNIGLQ